MFGFFKRIGRPFATIGRKFSQIFNLGRKAQPAGVMREQVFTEEEGAVDYQQVII